MARRRHLGATVLFTCAALAACATEAPPAESTDQELGEGLVRRFLFTGHWTNWHDRSVGLTGDLSSGVEKIERSTRAGQQVAKARGLLKLGAMRSWLEHDCLYDTNPNAAIPIAKGPSDVTCGAAEQATRTVDGTCNDLDKRTMGARGVRFGRNASPDHTFPDQDIYTPNPRDISLKLLARPAGKDGKAAVSTVPFLNMIAASWIQFEIHDWVSHGNVVNTGDVFSVPLAQDDPFRAKGMEIFVVPKTETRAADVNGKATFYNENTHWWDGSQLYGSAVATANGLRAHKGDLLVAELTLDNGKLPRGADGIEQTGFNRNWWLGLSMLHHLFASEHNQIVAKLRATHPEESEQWLFDHARMINAAVQAKLHTVEWTPAILPNPTLRLGMRANWYGLASMGKDNPEVNSEADALFKKVRIVDPGLNGIVGGKRQLGANDVPYSLTEEFTSVYRLHSLLPETLALKGAAGSEVVATDATRSEKAHAFTDKYPMHELFTSFGAMHPGTLTLHNFPRFMQDVAIPGFDHYDLGAVDILRDRERGVPRYNAFREAIQLKRLDSIDDITKDEDVRRQLKEIYGSDPEAINRVDLLVGTLAEGAEVRPESFGFGETTFQVFILMASRRLQADRFFTEAFNAEHYTKEGMDWITAATFKSILIRNYPELAAELGNVDNAFLPWDGSAGRDVPVDFPTNR